MYTSETQKIRPHIEQYCQGLVLDIGCGHDKVVPHALGVDCRKLPGVDVVTTSLDDLRGVLPEAYLQSDCIYSSHCLEHFQDDEKAVKHWLSLLAPGGVLILYLPDDRWYPNDQNPEHLHRYTRPQFLAWFTEKFPEATVIECGDHLGEDKYSFFMAARKNA